MQHGERIRIEALRGWVSRRKARAFESEEYGESPPRRSTVPLTRRVPMTLGFIACLFFVPFVPFCAMGAIIEIVEGTGPTAFPYVFGSLSLIALIGACALGWEIRHHRQRRNTPRRLYRLAHLARDNGLEFRPGPAYAEHLLPWPLHDEAMVSQVLVGDGAPQLEIGNMELRDHMEAGRDEHHPYTGTRFCSYCVVSPTDPSAEGKPPVQFLLRARHMGGRIVTRHGQPAGDQKVATSAALGRGHVLYAPKGYDDRAREIFTPYVLDAIRRGGRGMDVEVIGDLVVFSGRRLLVSTKRRHWLRTQRVMDAAEILARQVADVRSGTSALQRDEPESPDPDPASITVPRSGVPESERGAGLHAAPSPRERVIGVRLGKIQGRTECGCYVALIAVMIAAAIGLSHLPG